MDEDPSLVRANKHIIVVSHLFLFDVLLADTNGTVYTRNTFFNNLFVSNVSVRQYSLHQRDDHAWSFCRYARLYINSGAVKKNP